MDMWIPVDQLAERLNRRNHSWNDIVSIQHAPDFVLDACPSAGGKFAQQLPVETRMDSQAFGDGENYLSMRHRQTNVFGDVDASQQRALLVASWTRTTLLVRISDKPGTMLAWSLLAVCAAHPSKTFLEITTLEKGCHRLLDDRAPETVLGLKPFVIDLLKRVKILVDQTPQVGGTRIA